MSELCRRECEQVQRRNGVVFCARFSEPLEVRESWPLKCAACADGLPAPEVTEENTPAESTPAEAIPDGAETRLETMVMCEGHNCTNAATPRTFPGIDGTVFLCDECASGMEEDEANEV